MADDVVINIAEITAEIDKLSKEDLQKDLLAMRVRAKVQQKKNYDPAKMKLYQQRQRAKLNLMKERALKTPADDPSKYANKWEEINALAEIEAEKKVAESAEPEGEEAATA
jgi:hypothetical protein